MTETERIDWRGGGALALAAAITLAGSYRAFAVHAPLSVPALAALLGAAIATLALLACCAMPPAPRAVAMGATILATIACAARADLAGGTGVRVVAAMPADRSDASIATGGAVSDVARPGGSPSATGATVTLTGQGGAQRWAADAGAALSGVVAGGVAGAAAWSITGELAAAQPGPGRFAATAAWSIAGDGGSAHCGTIAISATGEGALIDALGAAFAVAVRRSASIARAACG